MNGLCAPVAAAILSPRQLYISELIAELENRVECAEQILMASADVPATYRSELKGAMRAYGVAIALLTADLE